MILHAVPFLFSIRENQEIDFHYRNYQLGNKPESQFG